MPRARAFSIPTVALLAILGTISVSDGTSRTLLANTALLCAAVSAAAAPVGLLLAICLRHGVYASGAAWAAIVACLFTPLYVQAAAWQTLFGFHGALVGAWGVGPWLRGWPGAIAVHVVSATPWAALVSSALLSRSDRGLDEAAALDMGPWRRAITVHGRMYLAALASAAVVSAVIVATEITITDLFRVRTYVEVVYMALAATGEIAVASIRSAPGVLLTIAAVAAVLWIVDDLLHQPRRFHALSAPPRLVPTICVWAVLFVLVALPCWGLFCKAGFSSNAVEGAWQSTWSATDALYVAATAPAAFGREIAVTAGLAVAAAVVATMLAVIGAWRARFDWPRRVGFFLLTAAAWATPGPLVAQAVIWLLNRPDPWPGGASYGVFSWLYNETPAASLLVLAWKAFAAAAVVLYAAWRQIPDQLVEAAQVDGCSRGKVLRRVVLPSSIGPLVVAFILAAAVAAGDLAASLLVLPPGWTTLSSRIFDRLHSGADAQVAGLCLCIWLAACIVGAAATVLRGNGKAAIQRQA